MKKIIIALLCLCINYFNVFASSYYTNGWTYLHEDIGWPDKNKYNYPEDNKYHLLKCIDCSFEYIFYKYPKSSCYKWCPNDPNNSMPWSDHIQNNDTSFFQVFQHPSSTEKGSKLVEIFKCENWEEFENYMKNTKGKR